MLFFIKICEVMSSQLLTATFEILVARTSVTHTLLQSLKFDFGIEIQKFQKKALEVMQINIH